MSGAILGQSLQGREIKLDRCPNATLKARRYPGRGRFLPPLWDRDGLLRPQKEAWRKSLDSARLGAPNA